MTLRLNGSTSGYVEVDAPAVSDNSLVTLPTGGGTLGRMQLMTAKSATGTAVDFTGIPSWVKRVTVMFGGVSTSGSSSLLIQIGTSSGFTTSGYASNACSLGQSGTTGHTASTAGFSSTTGQQGTASCTYTGNSQIALLESNTWIASSVISSGPVGGVNYSAGTVALAGTLDRVRITTVNGADTFDAGTINLLLEG